MAKNQLSHIKAHKLFTYMTNRAPDGNIPESIGLIAKEASLDLGFEVNPRHIDKAARELEITVVRHNKGCFARSNGAVEDHNVGEIVRQLGRIERKLNLIMANLSIKFVE